MDTSLGPVDIRVPTGADQERIAQAVDNVEAMEILLDCIVNSANINSDFDLKSLSAEDIAAIEALVENMSPEIATELLAQCPFCDANNRVAVNLYACLDRPLDELFADIHVIASHYHWSEHDILQMPTSHRQAYLRLIDLSRGMRRPADHIQAT